MTPEALKEVLQQHALWLEAKSKGKRAELSGVDLSGVNLSGVNLSVAYLTGANLSGVNLSNAGLRVAYLRGANLTGADLSGADLKGADLTGVNLSDANLTGADITGTKLSEAHFNYTKGIRYAVLSFAGLGEMSRQWLLVEQGGKPVFHIGCFCGSEDELLQRIEREPGEYEASRLDALDMLLRMYAYSKP